MISPLRPRHGGRLPIAELARRASSCALLMLTAATLRAQPGGVAFDFRSELKAPRPATALARGDFNNDGVPDILLAGPGYLTVLEQGSTSFEWRTFTGPASSRTPVLALAGRLNGDSRDDLLLLCGPRPATAGVYLAGTATVPALSATIELEGDVQQAALADLDGDTHTDILFYGKKSLGLSVYAGNGKGGFAQGPVLFPELSISLAAVARMDGDDIADIVLVDWIGNRLEIFPGFGGMHYGDPVVFPFDEEPIALAVADLNGDRHRDIVTGFGEKPGFDVFLGDGTGAYAAPERGLLEAPPGAIRIGDIDGDSRNDLLIPIPSKRSVVVRWQGDAARFTSSQSYSTGPAATDVVFFQDARKRYLNSAVLSADEGVVRILHNRSSKLPVQEGWTLATGSEPADLEIADLNDDGWADVALTHASEPVLNFFLNNGRGNLNGQASLALPVPVATLVPFPSPPGERDFFATVRGGKSFAYLSLRTADLAVTPLIVRTESAAEPVDGRIGAGGGAGKRIYTLKEGAGGTDATVLAYDIVDRMRYEETDIPLVLPDRIVATASYDFDGDGMKDLAFLTAGDTGAGYSLTICRQREEGFTPDRNVRLDLPAGLPPVVMLWVADLNGDLAGDLVLNAQKPANTLMVAMAGRGDTAFTAAAAVLQDVRIPSRKTLTATDFDADGRTDLVFVNEMTRTVQFLPGDGHGGFDGPVNLTSARGVSGFGVADINRDRESELILTIADEGILSVTSFHHPLFERKKRRNRE